MHRSLKTSKNLFFSHYVLLIFALFFLPFFSSCEKRRFIVNGIEEKEANEIIVLLSNKGIDAEKVENKQGSGGGGGGGQKSALWDISVKNEETTSAMSILNNAGFPRPKSQNLLNIFKDSSLVPTDLGEKIRYQAGLASQISSTIRNIDGILNADVLLSIPDPDPLNPNAPKKDITASVYVKHSGVLDDPNSGLATKIKNLVASSVSGLKTENVTLVPDRARFSDLAPGSITRSDLDMDYVTLWTITIAKTSVTTFRIIFFTFCILILLLTLIIVWIAWKTFPLLQAKGGLRELFRLRPITTSEEESSEEETKPKKDNKKKAVNPSIDNSLADESADFGGDINVYEDEDEES